MQLSPTQAAQFGVTRPGMPVAEVHYTYDDGTGNDMTAVIGSPWLNRMVVDGSREDALRAAATAAATGRDGAQAVLQSADGASFLVGGISRGLHGDVKEVQPNPWNAIASTAATALVDNLVGIVDADQWLEIVDGSARGLAPHGFAPQA